MEDKLHIIPLREETDRELLGYFAHLLPPGMANYNGDWEFICAFYEDKPCGIMSFIVDEEIILPWIYVDEEYRRRAVATNMLQFLQEYLEDRLLFTGFVCEIVLDGEGAGLDLIDFFASIEGIEIAPKYCIYEVLPEVYKEAFSSHPLFKGKLACEPLKFTDLPDYRKRAILNIPRVADMYQIAQAKRWEEDINKDLSLCIMEGDEVASAILVTDMDDDRLSIEMVYSGSMKAFRELLIAFGQVLTSRYADKSLIFRPVNDKIMELSEELFAEIMVYGEVWEASSF